MGFVKTFKVILPKTFGLEAFIQGLKFNDLLFNQEIKDKEQ